MIEYIDTKKVCSKCKIAKDVSLFDKFLECGDGLYPSCKSCKKIVKDNHRTLHPEQKREASKRHYEKHKIYINKRCSEYQKKNPHIRKKSLLNFVYGITPEEHQALLNINNGNCCICNKPPETRSLFIDHCHKTNVIRGVLCQKCNSGIAFFNDDIELLQSAIKYLSKENSYGLAKR